MGSLPTLDCEGTCSRYRANATAAPQDALQILADRGLNTVRLRLFGPDALANNSYANLSGVLTMAKRASHAGLAISLDIFYSQWYSGDASYYLQRRTPSRWRNLSFAQLVAAARNYTHAAVRALAAQGTPPSSVQVGNEINCGLFHPWVGAPCSAGAEVCTCADNWGHLAAVLTAGCEAARAAAPGVECIVQFAASQQLADGDKWRDLFAFYTAASAHGAVYDAIGVSFYQIWGAANVSNLCTLRELSDALPDKRIYVIETGYPSKPGRRAPGSMKPRPQFALTPQGQRDWLRALLFTVEHGLWGRGAGVSWWGAEYADPCSGDECAAFWDASYVAQPVLSERAFDPTGESDPPPGAVVCG